MRKKGMRYFMKRQRNKIVKSLEEINAKKEEADKKVKLYENNINAYQSEKRIKESRLKF